MSLSRFALGAALCVGPALLAQQLPKAEALLDKFVQATGGQAAYARQHTAIIKGTMEIGGMGLKGSLTVYRAEPNLSYTEIELSGLGKMQEGFDGKVAWAFNAMQGPQVKDGDEKANAMREARFHGENWKEDFKQVQTLGVETVEGRPCYKVQMTPHAGSPSLNFYDRESGLLLKTVATLKTAMGEITAESLPSDYRRTSGLLLPFKVIQKVAGQVITMTFSTVESNVPIPKGTFELPAEIKALLGKQP